MTMLRFSTIEEDEKKYKIADKNKDKLIHELTQMFISYEYERMHPLNIFNHTAGEINSRKNDAIRLYKNEPVFRIRVDYIVSNILLILEV